MQCPISYLEGAPEQISIVWLRWKRTGVLPYGGELAEQPLYIVEAFEQCEISHEVASVRRQAEEEARAEQEARKSGA